MRRELLKKTLGYTLIIIVLVGLVGLSFSIRNGSVSAQKVSDISLYNDTFMTKRALYQGLANCYNTEAKDKIEYGSEADWHFYTYLISSEGPSIFDNGGSVYIPTLSSMENELGCFDTSEDENLLSQIAKYSTKQGLAEIRVDDMDARNDFYTGMGYELGSSSGSAVVASEKCYSFSFTESGTVGRTNQLCVSRNESGSINNIHVKDNAVPANAADPIYVYLEGYEGSNFAGYHSGLQACSAGKVAFRALVYVPSENSNPYGAYAASDGFLPLCYAADDPYVNDIDEDFVERYLNGVREDVNDDNPDYQFRYEIPGGGHQSLMLGNLDIEQTNIASDTVAADIYTKTSDAINKAVDYLEFLSPNQAERMSEIQDWKKKFSDDELYYIYMRYLQNQYSIQPVIDYAGCTADDPHSVSSIPLVLDDGGSKVLKWCTINNYAAFVAGGDSNDELSYDSNNDGYLSNADELSATTIIGFISTKGRNLTDISKQPTFNSFENSAEADPNNPNNSTTNVGAATDSCQGAGGAGALGWIVCPIMEWMGGVATDAYNDFLKPQLQVAPELFANGQSGASYNAWSIFQGIANTIFSIILLIVIFSQLTGVGIDNYGIKRILPKLIIAAVATNLSYVICQLAVDLSNILGNSLQALFDGLAYGGSAMSFTVEGISQGSSIGPTILTGAVIAGVLVVGGIAIWSNPAVLLTLLVGLIGVVVAILFIFILLAARQAAVLILVVISPLAFVCYALPNTKKLFDKWLKMMQGLLIVYPICGLLIGGGNFASKLLLASGQNVSFISAFVAMLVSIVPLFFVPTVLKNSMNALGGLGGKISGIGKGLGGRAQGAARNTRGFKDAQKRSNARGDRLFDRHRAGIHIDRDGNVRNNRFSVRRRVAGTRIGRIMGWDAATGAAQAQYVKKQMDRQADINTFNERGIIDSQVTKAQNAEDERIIAGQVGVARNTVTARENIRQKADDERAKAEMEMDIKAVPVNRDNLRTRLINQVKETMADNAVPVIPVDVDLAIQRKQSATKAQELKNFTDQFASLSKGDLQKHADTLMNRVQSTGAVSGSDTQMMQALISTMESRGMEKNIAEMLKDGGSAIGSNSDVMQTLAGSKNRVFKAYGKGGAGLSYQEFMSGTNSSGQKLYRDKNGAITTVANGNDEVGMAKYARDKGADFINDLDDKALRQIANYQSSNNQIMSGDMIAQAQARINSQDAVDVLDGMMKAELDAGRSVNFSAAQFANLNDSTRQMLFDQGAHKGNMNVARNLLDISDEMVRNADLRAKLGDRGASYLDVMRATRATIDGGDYRSIRETVQANQQAQQGQQGQQTS